MLHSGKVDGHLRTKCPHAKANTHAHTHILVHTHEQTEVVLKLKHTKGSASALSQDTCTTCLLGTTSLTPYETEATSLEIQSRFPPPY